MIDPNNVMIRCPNGHELQAAKTDLDKPLACPVCSVTFTPSMAGATAPAPQPQALMQPVPGVQEPTTMSYAPEMLKTPISFPGYTNWMLGLWIGTYILQAINDLYQRLYPTTIDPTNPDIATAVILGFAGCFVGAAFLAALVLQFMWIYRIHKDALRGRQYQGVSPGLALGLSFIPLFNFFWTPWTMKKLARFAAETGEQNASGSAAQAVQATGVCLITAIVLILMSCGEISIMVPAFVDMFQKMMAAGPQGVDQQALQQEIAESVPLALHVASALISIAGVFIYAWAVRKLEASLYPFLGAPSR